MDGAAADFVRSPSNWPMLALKIDSARNLLWATEVALDGFTIAPQAQRPGMGAPRQGKEPTTPCGARSTARPSCADFSTDWGKSAVLCFDLRNGALLHRIQAPGHTALGDLALLPNGDPLVSDGDGGGLYRVTNGTLTQIDNYHFISPQTPAILPDGHHVLVPDYVRGIAVLDLAIAQPACTWLNRGPGQKFALNGIDGLYFDRGSLILTQNGTSPERVVRMRLNATFNEIESAQIIERSTPNLGDPTHGVIVDDSFFYIANAGWNVLDHADLKTGMRLTQPRIMRYRFSEQRTE